MRSQAGRTPLHCAAEAGHGKCCEALLEAGAAADAADKDGSTAMQLAMGASKLSVATMLASRGCSVLWKDKARPQGVAG